MARETSSNTDSEKPLVTIVVLTYNNIEGVYKTLNSIFFQDYPMIELVLSDDGSAGFDDCIAGIKEFVEHHSSSNIVRFAVNALPINSGTVKNINSSLSFVSGRYVMFLAAEDSLSSTNTLSHFVSYMEDYSQCDVCFAKLRGIDEEGTIHFERFSSYSDYDLLSSLDSEHLLRLLYACNPLPAPSAFFRSNVFDRFGPHDESMRLVEDHPYWLHLISNNASFGFIDECAVDYAMTGTTSTAKYNYRVIKDLQVMHEKYVFPNDNRFGHFQRLYNIIKRRGLKYALVRSDWGNTPPPKQLLYRITYMPFFIYDGVRKH